MECNKFENGSIYRLYCGRLKTDDKVQDTAENDEYCRYFHDHNVTLRPGIPGLASGVFFSEFLLVFFTRFGCVTRLALLDVGMALT